LNKNPRASIITMYSTLFLQHYFYSLHVEVISIVSAPSSNLRLGSGLGKYVFSIIPFP
jgi:hypothetical protein